MLTLSICFIIRYCVIVLPSSHMLTKLRALLVAHDLAAVIVPSEDAHQSEYVSEYDKRRGFITGCVMIFDRISHYIISGQHCYYKYFFSHVILHPTVSTN
jgi:hypothetical protein